jgi:hypothetical protein
MHCTRSPLLQSCCEWEVLLLLLLLLWLLLLLLSWCSGDPRHKVPVCHDLNTCRCLDVLLFALSPLASPGAGIPYACRSHPLRAQIPARRDFS